MDDVDDVEAEPEGECGNGEKEGKEEHEQENVDSMGGFYCRAGGFLGVWWWWFI